MGDMLMGDTSPVKRQKMCNEAFCSKICSEDKEAEIQLVKIQRSLGFVQS